MFYTNVCTFYFLLTFSNQALNFCLKVYVMATFYFYVRAHPSFLELELKKCFEHIKFEQSFSKHSNFTWVKDVGAVCISAVCVCVFCVCVCVFVVCVCVCVRE